ncbi:solute carrier family 23 protein, partial [Enterococcus faecalis]|uniref:solute carrier family 23 protein n=1 Tax=Enterococcus faecalis TaxID=1351 RepID=UPI003D6ADD2D
SALKKGRIFRVSSIILALLFASIAAQLLGVLDLSAVSEATWFSLPQLPLVNFSFQFDWSSIVTIFVIYLVLMVETTGTWFSVSHVVAEPLSEEKI